jgi:hypothetical protein
VLGKTVESSGKNLFTTSTQGSTTFFCHESPVAPIETRMRDYEFLQKKAYTFHSAPKECRWPYVQQNASVASTRCKFHPKSLLSRCSLRLFYLWEKMVRSLQLAKYQCVQSDSLPKDYNNIKITQDAKCLLDVEQVCECLPLAGKQLHPTSS